MSSPLEEYLSPGVFKTAYAILRNASDEVQKIVVEHIDTHKYFLNLNVQSREISPSEAYSSWVEYVFEPHYQVSQKTSPKVSGDIRIKETLALCTISFFLKRYLPKEQIEVHPKLSMAYLDSYCGLGRFGFFWEHLLRAKTKRWSGYSVLKELDKKFVERL